MAPEILVDENKYEKALKEIIEGDTEMEDLDSSE